MIDPISLKLLRSAGSVSFREGRGPIVLMYHGIHSGRRPGPWPWSLPVTRFESQMIVLKNKGWTTFNVSDLKDINNLPSRSVAITFDDGFQNNFEFAFPLLSKLGMRATWFITTKDIGGRAGWKDICPYPRSMLSKGQIREMAGAGMEIGAHSRTHPDFTTLTETELRDEIGGSKADLEDILGSKVVSFAYPFGRFNAKVMQMTDRAGFKFACTTNPGWVGSDLHPLRVRRIAVFSNDTESSFARKLAFADTNVNWPQIFRYLAGRIMSRVNNTYKLLRP